MCASLHDYFADAAAFSCETDLVAAVGEVDLQISCTITANPPVNVDSVWWTFSRSDMNLTHEQSRGELSSRIAVSRAVTHLGPISPPVFGRICLVSSRPKQIYVHCLLDTPKKFRRHFIIS